MTLRHWVLRGACALGLVLGLLSTGCDEGTNPPGDGGQDGLTQDGDGLDGADGTGLDGGDGTGTCLPTGAGCEEASACCSGRCHEGLCGECLSLGEACAASAACCSGRCEAEAGGGLVCVLGGGCLPDGELCRLAADCCSLACQDGRCVAGALCAVVGADCQADADCCSNDCGADEVCVSVGGGCLPLGERCGNDSSCCSGSCREAEDGFRCVLASICRGEGEICALPGDCCTGVCVDGRCPLLDGCGTAGEPCTGFHECCSGLCTDPGTGTRVCQYVSGCRPIGEVCLQPVDCCGQLCTQVVGGVVKRCEKPQNPGCLSAGETCGGFSQGTAYNCCPSGPSGGAALCLETVLGITRCYGEGTPQQCLQDGVDCSFADECCSGFCLPDTQGRLVCGASCVPEGGRCTSVGDCCLGLVCLDGLCQDNPFPCIPLGGACQTREECCTSDCVNGRCTEN